MERRKWSGRFRRKERRYILMMDSSSSSSMKKVQDELQVKFTSSAELSSEVSAEDVLEVDKGIFYKNIGVAVVDDVDIDQMKHSADLSGSKIYYWEEERIFEKASYNPLEQLKKIKQKLLDLEEEVSLLELILMDEYGDLPDIPFQNTWGLDAVNFKSIPYTGKGINVCILDTGFYAAHPDFINRNIIGKSFVRNEAWDYDGDGHGTHCVGTAVGGSSESTKIRYGIASGANIIIGKVLSDDGYGSTSNVIDGIDWALEKNARIISMSLASQVNIGERPSPIFEQIGNMALEQNALIIAAAGNDSNRPSMSKPVSSPANAESIMAIGAVDNAMNIAKFSNRGVNASTGGKIDLVAPGVEVFSSFSKNEKDQLIYKKINGTSMATPHVAGIAALYLEQSPNLTAKELWEKLEKTAISIKGLLKSDVGYGLSYFKK